MKIGVPTKAEHASPPGAADDGIDYLVNVFGDYAPDTFYHCPCCAFPTLTGRGHFDLCAVCFWEDDGQDQHDADRVRGGPNGDLSLSQAIANFVVYGACEERVATQVRLPTQEEMRHRKNDI